jgi:hypothetical protein
MSAIIKDGHILVFIKSHNPVHNGDVVTLSRGEIVTVTGGRPPHTPASTGRVYVRHDTGVTSEYFPNVIDAKWVTLSNHDEHQQGRASHDPD